MAGRDIIIIGSDHAGYTFKEAVKQMLQKRGLTVKDVGPMDESSVDYTDFAAEVAVGVSNASYSRGILICGTGLGMSMAANRFPRVRAALVNGVFCAKMARAHNNANILCMGARVIGLSLAEAILDAFLETEFEGGRHQRRIGKMDAFNAV